jgi:phosphoribosyl-dephospho-CoA transferase
VAWHCKPSDQPIRRHDLTFVSPAGWCSLIKMRDDLAGTPLVGSWVQNGWPLIGRRATPGEGNGVALGLPLPPFAGKRRLSFLMRPEDIVATAPPPPLRLAGRAAPRAWWPTLDRLDVLASQYGVKAEVFGSLAWRAITGLDYLTDSSDLDLLLHVQHETDLHRLASDVALIDAAAPMRLDGELVRADGAAVNWREIHAGAQEVLVKTVCGVALLDTSRFILGKVAS